jgi:hypothetical protein
MNVELVGVRSYGYGGYRVLAERGDLQVALCWSHVRRRFYELAAAGPAPIANTQPRLQCHISGHE